jgi:hypothetical protein
MALDDYLNQIARNTGQAPRDRTISDAFYGLNIIGRNAPIVLNTENHGFTFFTRPCMNMSYDNLQVDRMLSLLLNPNPASMERMLRCYMDPWSQTQGQGQALLTCPGVDYLSPFIPLLSNNLISLTGFDDFTIGTHSSEPGLYRESYSYVDDVPYQYGTYDLTATFRNISGDPISLMMRLWGQYMGLVYEGRLMPYPELVLMNELDYNTRIWRLMMDASRTYVTSLGAANACFPMTAPIGQKFNFTGDGSETPFQQVQENISISFRCHGFTYYDHILVYEFNTLQEEFNPNMRADRRDSAMQKLRPWEREYFNYQSYPRINPLDMELEWYVPMAVYNQAKSGVLRQVDTAAQQAVNQGPNVQASQP